MLDRVVPRQHDLIGRSEGLPSSPCLVWIPFVFIMIPTGSIATMLCLASSAAGTQHERWIGHRFTWQHYGRTWWTSTARLWLWATTALLPGFVSLFLWNPAIVRCLTFALTGR